MPRANFAVTHQDRLSQLIGRLRARQLQMARRGAVVESAHVAQRVTRLRRAAERRHRGQQPVA